MSYGSNLSSRRLRFYLSGGTPPGGSHRNPGARDPRPPRRAVPVELPGALYFAGCSPQWGGGVALYDHDHPGPTAARAYLVTAAQFVDIAAQEMHRMPTGDGPLERLVADGLGDDDGGRHAIGAGLYETLVQVGRRDGLPMLTFTAAAGRDAMPHRQPSRAYLRTIATGLGEAHGWAAARTRAYLRSAIRSAR